MHDKLVFERRRDKLKTENEVLQSLLNQVINGTTVNDETMKLPNNPLLTVTGNIMSKRIRNQDEKKLSI
jgi:response regulator of citrate/malate metabolism